MSFVPIVPQPPPTPRTNELGERLRETIDAFRRDHPGMSPAEVRQAMDLARQAVRTPNASGAATALLIGVFLLGILVYFLVGRGMGLAQPPILIMVVGAAVLAIAVAVVLKNR